MTEGFILWAQALDNASPDHFEVQGDELAVSDSARRQEVVSQVSRVIKNGARVYESDGVLLTADARNFVLDVPSAQRDRAGRTAPIVCYGEYDAAFGDELGAAAAVAIDDFARRIGRTLLPEHFELARASFQALKKNSSRTRLVHTIRIGAVGFALLVLAYWLASRGG